MAPAYLAGYLDVAREQLAAHQRMKAADDRFFHLFTRTMRPRELPPGADEWTVPAGPAPEPLADGQRIDLGGRSLTVLHTPGHSADSLCLLDEKAGLLFAGTPGTDLLLRPALRHEFAEFTVLRPLPAGRWDTGSS